MAKALPEWWSSASEILFESFSKGTVNFHSVFEQSVKFFLNPKLHDHDPTLSAVLQYWISL